MNKHMILVGALLCSLIMGRMTVVAQHNDASMPALQHWRQDKFGMFLHWGLYSQAAGDWNGKRYKGNEHFMIYEKVSLKEYGTLATAFDPVQFNAEQWVKRAKQAGMKYIIITAKHHDGFAMYNSTVSDYNIVKKSPFARDPLKELAQACKKEGIQLGFYYSLGRDWEDPDVPTNWPSKGGRSNLVDYPNEDIKDIAKYVERKVKPQLRELLTQYGPVAVLWFDTPELITKEQSTTLLQMIKTLQPNCIVNSRIGNGLGDYKVSEQQISTGINRQPWEACITMSKGWGYNKYDNDWKSPELLVRLLVEIVSKGGNLLLNVAPNGKGEFPEPAIERLKAIGDWMKINQEAIYGTTPWTVSSEQVSDKTLSNAPVHDALGDVTSKVVLPDIYFTAKENAVYVIARSWTDPLLNVQSMADSKVQIQSVSLLGSSEKIKWKQSNELLEIKMPKKIDTNIPVYVFKVMLK